MQNLLLVSRPRFWVYVLGPVALGAAAAFQAGTGAFSIEALLLCVYFSFPANVFIYGVNDIFDYDTDVLNEKKQGYEPLVLRTQHRELWRAILFANALAIPLMFMMNTAALIAFLAFLFLGFFYSAPPIRAKARPLFDSVCNALYVMPGITSYVVFGGESISWMLVLAGVLWSMAMHAYSAVPDIHADAAAGIRTIATVLGTRGTLVFCGALYGIAGGIAGVMLGLVGWIGLGVYLFLIALSWRASTQRQYMNIYKRFPVINATVGALLFFSILL